MGCPIHCNEHFENFFKIILDALARLPVTAASACHITQTDTGLGICSTARVYLSRLPPCSIKLLHAHEIPEFVPFPSGI